MNIIFKTLMGTALFLTMSVAEYSYPMDGSAPAELPGLNGSTGQSTENVIKSMNETGISSRSSESKIKSPSQVRKLEGYDEAIYEQLSLFNRMDQPGEIGLASPKAYDIIAFQQGLLDEAAKKKAKKEAVAELMDTKKHEINYAQGYCYLDKDIFIERLATYAYFSCDFGQPVGHAQLAVSMIPEFYAKAIIANPLYIIPENGKRLPIANGVVMTKDKNSINLANIINDRLVEKIVITSGYKGLGMFATQAQAFLDAKSAARYSQTSTTTGGLTPVVIQDTRIAQPRIEDYFATATVQLVSELAKVIGENMVKNLPYTFKVNKGNVFFADVQFANDGNMEGYKISQPNIVKREPEFLDGKEMPTDLEQIPVKNNHSGTTIQSPDKEKITTTKTPQKFPVVGQ